MCLHVFHVLTWKNLSLEFLFYFHVLLLPTFDRKYRTQKVNKDIKFEDLKEIHLHFYVGTYDKYEYEYESYDKLGSQSFNFLTHTTLFDIMWQLPQSSMKEAKIHEPNLTMAVTFCAWKLDNSKNYNKERKVKRRVSCKFSKKVV